MTERAVRRMAHVRAVTGPGIDGAGPDEPHRVTLHLITPGVVDDYGSLWMPDTFDEDLNTRLPAMAWAHNWSEPLGRGVDFRTSTDGPDVIFEFDNFDDVPIARRAFSQVRSGTITDCSVGFFYQQKRDPTEAEVGQFPGVKEIIEKAGLDEVSLVLRGAVPGAKVLALRSAGGEVADSILWEVSRKVAAGDLTEAEGKAALRLAAENMTPPPDPEPVQQTEQERVELEQAVKDAMTALEDRGL